MLCTMPPLPLGSGCAALWPGATGRISRASRPVARRPPSRVEWPPNSAHSPTHRPSRRSVRTPIRRPENNCTEIWMPRLSQILFAAGSVTLFCAAPILTAQSGAKNGEWRTYGGDLGNTRYSPLDQINATNFDKLQIAWRFNTASLGPTPEFNLEATPLMARGVLYSVVGSRRDVVALDAATGELLWVHREEEGRRGQAAPRRLSGRGLAYWSDGREERILFVTPGYRLIALDAKTGNLR